MFVIVNGQAHPLPKSRTLAALLLSLSPPAPFAVARNDEVVPRETYEDCRIYPGDLIDIVHPTAGG
jgi:thiamine biosynthesis protein ThiS